MQRGELAGRILLGGAGRRASARHVADLHRLRGREGAATARRMLFPRLLLPLCRLDAAHKHSEHDSLLLPHGTALGNWHDGATAHVCRGSRRDAAARFRAPDLNTARYPWGLARHGNRVSRLPRAPLQGSLTAVPSHGNGLSRESPRRFSDSLLGSVSRENVFSSRGKTLFSPLSRPSSRWAAPRPPRLVTGRPGWSLFALSHGNARLGSGRPRRDDSDLSVPATLQARSFGRSPRALPFPAWHWKGRCPVCAPGAVRCTELVRRREYPREGKTLRPCSTQPPPVR